jgi:hypothetical protein
MSTILTDYQSMPLFRKNKSSDSDSPPRRDRFFGRSTSSTRESTPPPDSSRRGNSLRRSRHPPNNTNPQRPFPSFFGHRIYHTSDPTILAARQKVTDAEDAEKEADKALQAAIAAVKEARQHVRNLEKEAAEE